MAERLVSGDLQQEDQDVSLRPKRLEDFVGQSNTKENLSISIQAAKIRQEPLDHVIIYGPPGLGKTTLANIIATEMEVAIRVTSGPAVERAGDMAAILTSLQPGDVLFIDEVHRLNRVVEEVLYSAMEDFFLSWMVGKGLAARGCRQVACRLVHRRKGLGLDADDLDLRLDRLCRRGDGAAHGVPRHVGPRRLHGARLEE